MDEFAKEYLKKLKGLAHDFKSRRKELAESRIKMFAAAITRQLLENHEIFDLLIGAGNSGLYMTKIAEMTYRYLNIPAPKILNIPIMRFEDDGKTLNDNSSLLPKIKQDLNKINTIKNILFVDDEIMRGITANECFKLLLNTYTKITHLDATIIAENHFFEWHYKIPKISVRFFAYSPLIQDLNGNIGHFIPENLYKEIFSLIKDVTSYNRAMAIVIGGGLKKKDPNGNYYFDLKIESSLKDKIAGYDDKKSKLKAHLQELVKNGVEEFKKQKIKFRF